MEGGTLSTPIVVSMGDPAGVGPEIIVKAWNRIVSVSPAVVAGDVATMKRAAEEFYKGLEVVEVKPGDPIEPYPGYVPVIQGDEPGEFEWGKPTDRTAMASLSYIDLAMIMVRLKKARAMVTCPVSKERIRKAGAREFTGHTEFIAGLLKVKRPVMCMVGERLKVALLTTHVPLRDVPRLIGEEDVVEVVSICHRELKEKFRIEKPKMAISALNPHAGEGGEIGDEEERIFKPAIEKLRSMGMDVEGPIPGDTVYYRAYMGEFDLVVSPYHDQALSPFKLIHFKDGVNVTLGLPIVRTSVDHGPAYDIAGKGIASEESLINAFIWAKILSES